VIGHRRELVGECIVSTDIDGSIAKRVFAVHDDLQPETISVDLGWPAGGENRRGCSTTHRGARYAATVPAFVALPGEGA
jgi:hypothetical protein